MDVHDKQTRSYNMSRIKGKDTKPELLVRKFLYAHGFRYKLHDKKLPGKPDIVLPKYNTVIFMHTIANEIMCNFRLQIINKHFKIKFHNI